MPSTPPAPLLPLLLVAAALQATLPAAAAERAAPGPTILASAIPPAVSGDLGKVVQGRPVELVITITNDGSAPLVIGAVQPLCACMSERSVREIPAGASGTVTLHLETTEYSGPTTEAALIQWVNAPLPVTRVELKLDVEPVLEVLPKRLVRFRTTFGQASAQEVELRAAGGKPFKVTAVEPSAPYLTATATAIAPGAFRLSITLSAQAPKGMLKESLTVRTDLPTIPALKLNVTGLVADEAVVAPGATSAE